MQPLYANLASRLSRKFPAARLYSYEVAVLLSPLSAIKSAVGSCHGRTKIETSAHTVARGRGNTIGLLTLAP